MCQTVQSLGVFVGFIVPQAAVLGRPRLHAAPGIVPQGPVHPLDIVLARHIVLPCGGPALPPRPWRGPSVRRPPCGSAPGRSSGRSSSRSGSGRRSCGPGATSLPGPDLQTRTGSISSGYSGSCSVWRRRRGVGGSVASGVSSFTGSAATGYCTTGSSLKAALQPPHIKGKRVSCILRSQNGHQTTPFLCRTTGLASPVIHWAIIPLPPFPQRPPLLPRPGIPPVPSLRVP